MQEVREMTLSARILESWVMTSSVIPSLKNSSSGSAGALRIGETRRDDPAEPEDGRDDGLEAAVDDEPDHREQQSDERDAA
jgi:hypothetical protein